MQPVAQRAPWGNSAGQHLYHACLTVASDGVIGRATRRANRKSNTLTTTAPNDPETQEGAVLFADVSGSTALYQSIGDQAALATIRAFLEELQQMVANHGGIFVKASGDDVLCWFPDAQAALTAAREMLQATGDGGLEVHAGLEWGAFLSVENDIFGDCVNASARLCSLANQRELLVGDVCFQRFDDVRKLDFVRISALRLRGRSEASRIYSLQLEGTGDRTHLDENASDLIQKWDAIIEYEGQQWRITEGDALAVGRLEENTVFVASRSVSRQHATIRLTNGLVEFEDHSSTGSAVIKGTGEELAVLRRTVVLSGSGTIFLGSQKIDARAPRLFYDVVPR